MVRDYFFDGLQDDQGLTGLQTPAKSPESNCGDLNIHFQILMVCGKIPCWSPATGAGFLKRNFLEDSIKEPSEKLLHRFEEFAEIFAISKDAVPLQPGI